jgi:hypothetical protein
VPLIIARAATTAIWCALLMIKSLRKSVSVKNLVGNVF